MERGRDRVEGWYASEYSVKRHVPHIKMRDVAIFFWFQFCVHTSWSVCIISLVGFIIRNMMS